MNNVSLAVQISDVEVKELESGKIATTIGVFLAGYGEKQTQEQVKLTARNGVGERLATVPANSILMISGRFQVNTWQTQEGEKRKGYEISISDFAVVPVTELFKHNVITVAGNMGSDPEVKYFESGNSIAKISIASNRTKQITDWLEVSFWNNQAATIADYARKGTKLAVVGELQCEHWKDKGTGDDRHKFTIKGNTFQFLGGGTANANDGGNKSDYDDEF